MTLLSQLGPALERRYAIDREIGDGGMATVYLARDLRHDRPVAVKVLNPELGAVLGVERFLAEIRVTANLQHPNLLPLFDSGEAAGLLYYVMPFVEGESLRARLDRERQLPVDEAVRIALAVGAALEYAHAHGVIHRDHGGSVHRPLASSPRASAASGGDGRAWGEQRRLVRHQSNRCAGCPPWPLSRGPSSRHHRRRCPGDAGHDDAKALRMAGVVT
jgi:hypothetical protein